MRVADIVSKKNAAVSVRVPAQHREQLGETVDGRVLGLTRAGRTVMVRVKVSRRGEWLFRPQDISLR